MKALITILVFVPTVAAAQEPMPQFTQCPAEPYTLNLPLMPGCFEMPNIVPLNDAAGNRIGTAVINKGKTYLRNLDGKLFATIVYDPREGTRTMYDENGKVLDQIKGLPKLPDHK